MTKVISQHVCHLGRQLGFFEKSIFSKIAANYFELSRKHVFQASYRYINTSY